MFKFIMNKGQQANHEGSHPHENYFTFSKVATFGFPSKPTALAWDPVLCLMAIGTQNGNLRIYGAPGVQFVGQSKGSSCIINLMFIPNWGRLVSLCADNSLHLWELKEINGLWEINEIKSFILEGLMKRITAVFLASNSNILYMGTVCGNIYTLNVNTFEAAESVIYQDVVLQNISDDSKLNQGAVKVIQEQPGQPDCLLFGYHQGLVVLWNIRTIGIVSTFLGSQNLESVAWHRGGSKFMSSHSDGSYVVWNIADSTKPAEVPITPYGPFSCKAINKIAWNTVKGGDDYIIFSGGMPRASYGDKNTVTIMCGDKHDVLDISSRVIDFFTISDAYDESDFDNPHSLIVLVEEELIAIDLECDSWLPFRMPYLECPHSSPISCIQYCPNVHKDFWRQVVNICQKQTIGKFSENVWPITGGKSLVETALRNILITGHEDGSVKLWNSSPTSMQLLYAFHTSCIFTTYESCPESNEELEEWPPFRKVGSFEPLSDDPRLTIRKVFFNDITQTLIVGGTGGQILVLQMMDVVSEKETKVSLVHFVTDWDTLTWNGHPPLSVKSVAIKYEEGFHLQCLIQVIPPAAIATLSFHAEWNLLAAGTFHGLLLYDIIQKKCILSKCSSTSGDVRVSGADISPRSKSLKKTLRESFRKLRKGKSQVSRKERTGSLSSEIQKDGSRENSMFRESIASSPDPTITSSPSPELRSFDGDTESRTADDTIGCLVQSVYFAQSFIINNVITTPTFWAGTSRGNLHVYTISMPINESRTSTNITSQLGKEIQLKHHAPILAIQVVDHRGYPLPDPTEIQYQRAKPADLCGSHRVIVCTEEQIKVFTLPSMKPYCKYKVTATEGCNICRVGFSTFQSVLDSKSYEHCVVCLSNTGNVSLYSIPDLKKLVSYRYSSPEDISFFPNLVFTNDGQAIRLNSLSEFEMTSFSTLYEGKAVCHLDLPEHIQIEEPQTDIVLQVHDLHLNADEKKASELSEEDSNLENDKNPSADGSADIEKDQPSSGAVGDDGALNLENTNIDFPPPGHEFRSSAPENVSTRMTPVNQVRRAPIASIDEFNSVEESYARLHDCNFRRSYCGSK